VAPFALVMGPRVANVPRESVQHPCKVAVNGRAHSDQARWAEPGSGSEGRRRAWSTR
jgi:hypothetical protein